MNSINGISVGSSTYALRPRTRSTAAEAAPAAGDAPARPDTRKPGYVNLTDFATAVNAAPGSPAAGPTTPLLQAYGAAAAAKERDPVTASIELTA